jgi:hypothetical protein
MAAACPPRHVYLDLGANWGNTARLFESIGGSSTKHARYEIYGFEASPLIQPFAEQFFAWLNGTRTDEPKSCIPRTGSSAHLGAYAAAYGCPSWAAGQSDKLAKGKMNTCMESKLAPHLAALHPDPALNDTALIDARLNEASAEASCRSTTHRHRHDDEKQHRHRYTFVPAAAAGHDAPEYLTLYTPPASVFRGGSMLTRTVDERRSPRNQSYDLRVRTVDLSGWIARSFSPRDHIVMKIDVEGYALLAISRRSSPFSALYCTPRLRLRGPQHFPCWPSLYVRRAEHSILRDMIKAGTMPLIDVLALECHGSGRTCEALHSSVARAAPQLVLLQESGSPQGGNATAYSSVDAYSGIPSAEWLAKLVRACM